MLGRRLLFFLVFCCVLSSSFKGAAAGEKKMRKVPVAKGLASHPVNGGRCLISDGQYQYIAFYDTMGLRKTT
jgi:hypothetical protein